MENNHNMPKNDNVKPLFWECEDGNFYPVDPSNIRKCSVCGKSYKVKTFPIENDICSPGCSLKLTESKGQSDG